MTSRLTKVLAAGATFATFAVVTAAPALASTKFTVKAGSAKSGTKVAFTGKTTGSKPQIKFSDSTTGVNLTCNSGSAPGVTKVGKGRSGKAIATITGPKTKFNGCVGPSGLTFKVTGFGAWNLNAAKYKSGKVAGTITNIKAVVNDPNICTFTATGSVNVTYSDKTHTLAVSGKKATLTLSKVNCALPVVRNGDKASFAAVYKLSASKKSQNPITIS